MYFIPCTQNQKFIKENFQNISIDIEACDSHVQEELYLVENVFQNQEVEYHAYTFSDQPVYDECGSHLGLLFT